jgi:N-acetylmuramoyl-L-alanine amidase
MPSTFTRRRFVASAAGAVAFATATAAIVTSPASARSSDRFTVTANGLRLRSGPGTGYSVLASLSKGTEVRFLASGGSANGYDWGKFEVVATGRVGYLAFQYLIGKAVSGPQVKVNSGPLNVRSAPGIRSSVLRTVPAGAIGLVTAQMPQTKDGYVWVNVAFSSHGVTGWVAKSFLTWI